MSRFSLRSALFCAAALWLGTASAADEPLRVLFLGDQGHHRPSERFRELQPVLAARGIELTYTEDLGDLTAARLAECDALAIYANIEQIPPAAETALLDYVAQGGGLVALHCASFCFHNSPRYVELVGAQFARHGAETFRTEVPASEHPVAQGYAGFRSWDETYVHHRHNDAQRTVLEYRVDAEGREPWTWVRSHERGRVFYTAWGHDQRTWNNPGYHNLVERGIRWAAGADVGVVPAFDDAPATTVPRTDVQPFEYVAAELPFYPAGEQWGTIGEPIRQMQTPLPADESLKHVVVPAGFEVRLFAAEPDIGKPICLNWDERGRLWIAETVDYPNELQPPGQGRDRIRICEDTDHDGRADKFTVFADQLSIPTSLIFARGGVIVHQAPDTLFLIDENDDDVCDRREVLFTGWSTADTHAGPSNLQYGLDNWLYSIVGYAGFEGAVGGQQHSFRTGFFRFRADGSQLEFLRNTNNNSWGVGFSEEGVLFGSTANGNPSEYLPIANRYYEQVRGWSSSVLGGIAEDNFIHPLKEEIRQVDHHGGFTAGAGHALYTARAWPEIYWNRAAFVSEPTGHLTATFLIQPDGAGYSAHNAWNLFASDDEWTAPIAAEVGPDGQVWLIDWYNYIVQHNPTPAGYETGPGNAYVTDLRDKTHGRIYRVVYLGDPALPEAHGPRGYWPRSLHGAAPAELVAALCDDNLFWRRHAQRLLVERGEQDVVPALLELLRDRSVDRLGLNVGAIHALWTLQGLGALHGPQSGGVLPDVFAALAHPAAGVRRNAAAVLPPTVEATERLLEAGLLSDFNGQVRLAALLKLAEVPPQPLAAAALWHLLSHDELLVRDRWLREALTAAAAAQAPEFLPRIAEFAGRDALLPVAAGVVRIVAEHVARSGNAERLPDVLAALAADQPALTAALLDGLAAGWPKDQAAQLDAGSERMLLELLPQLEPAVRSRLVQWGQRLGSAKLAEYAAELAAEFLVQAADPALDDAARAAAAAEYVAAAPQAPDAAEELLALVTPQTSPELAQALLAALRASEADETGAALVAGLPALTPGVRAAALRLLLEREPWTLALLDALDESAVQLAEFSLDERQRLANHPTGEIAARARALLERGGGLPNPDRLAVLEQLLPLVERTDGDPAVGLELFKKHCAKCHVHSGEGNRIGPELTGMAVHPKAELLTQILDPSRSVEGNFRSYTVVLTDGRIFTGLLASETRTSLELIDAEAKRQTLLREDVEQLVVSSKSLMPEGFEKQLTPDELVHLLAFLTKRGRFTPLSLERVATVCTTRGMFYSEEADVERLIFDDWSPKQFAGVPFALIDPQGRQVDNAVMLYGPQGNIPPTMPRSVTLPCAAPAKAIHFLSGVSGWGYPLGTEGSVTLIVRLHYADGQTEDHPLLNGVHFADYIRQVDVPKSQLAFLLRGQQLRYLAVHPARREPLESIELVKGDDDTAPLVLAVTLEAP